MKMLEVFNENNSLLIDDEMFNLVLKRKLLKSDFKMVERKYPFEPICYRFEMLPDEDFIAISSLTGEYISHTTWGGGENSYIEFYDEHDDSTGISDSIVGYTFGEPDKEPSRHLTGFECYNEKGEVVFSSKYKYLRCLDFCTSISEHDNEIIGKTLALINFDIYQEDTDTYNSGDKTLESETFTDIGYLHGSKYGTHTQHALNVDTDVNNQPWRGSFHKTRYLGSLQYMIIDVTGY